MCIIDRYLLRQFLQTFVICFISVMGLYVIVDVSANLEHFVECGRKTGGVLRFIAQYYAYRWIWLFSFISGLLALVSAMFTVAWIQRHNEMTALMGAGVSRIRVLTPIIVAVAVVSLAGTASRELVIPRYRDQLSRRPQDPLGSRPQGMNPRYDYRTDVLLGGATSYADQMRIEQPNFILPASLGEYGKEVSAENAYFMPADGNHPAGYLFRGVREPKHLDTRPSLALKGEAVLITPRDAPDWLKPNECFICSDVGFEQLAGGEAYKAFKELSSTAQLIAALRNPSLDFGADVRVAIHARIVQPLLDMTLLFLGLPLIINRENRNVFLAMGISLAVTVAFLLTVIGLQKLGEVELFSPALSAWAPLMIFVPLATGIAGYLWK